MTHEDYMRLALDLARKGEGYVAPNPMVGTVIVRNGRIIGRGYHQYFGGPHAEINAINSIRNPEHIKGSTLYLTLEPCSHFGKTPPCAEAICYSGIKQVVIASRDPNPLVRGKGIRLLKQHGGYPPPVGGGINVIEGVLEDEARAINAPFFKTQETGLPYVVAKWAMSMDGKMAYPNAERHKGAMSLRRHRPRWITTKRSRDYAKSIRGQCQAVMVGIGTVLKDNPGLMAKVKSEKLEVKSKKPIRIILDSRARLPLVSKLIKTIAQGPVWVVASASATRRRIAGLEQKGVRVFRVPGSKGKLDFMAVLRTLAKNGISKLMIEGGPEVLASAFKAKVVDEVYCFVAPKVISVKDSRASISRGIFKVTKALQLNDITVKYLKPDALIHGIL